MNRIRIFLFLFLFAATARAAETKPRLVSLAPSLTEMVFAIGAGDLLVGVTDDCRHPAGALAIAKVGPYRAHDFQAVAALSPDIILTLAEHAPVNPVLAAASVRYEIFDHGTLEGVLDSYVRLGDICGRPYRAGKLRDELHAALVLPSGYREDRAPAILLVMGREYDADGGITGAAIVGKDGLYNRLITAAGGKNAYRGDAPYPSLSGENLAPLGPDIIVEAVRDHAAPVSGEGDLLADWRALAHTEAMLNGRVFYIRADYVFAPGTRMALMKRDLADIVGKAGF